MSMDRSLKTGGKLVRHRNVLTRPERLKALGEQEKWKEGMSVYNLVKVAHRKVVTKKAAKTAVEAVPGAEGAAVPAAGAPAAGAKGAATAAGAKGAAPAAAAAAKTAAAPAKPGKK